jgi:hypothetical protein
METLVNWMNAERKRVKNEITKAKSKIAERFRTWMPIVRKTEAKFEGNVISVGELRGICRSICERY